MATVTDLRYDRVLGNVSIAFEQAELVADRVVPVVGVGATYGRYPRWGLEAFRVNETLRTPRSRANEMTHTFDWQRYATEQHRLTESVADEERRDANQIPGANFALEREAVETATSSLNLGREKRVSRMVRDPDALGGSTALSGTDQLTDSSSNPFEVVNEGKFRVRARVGRVANVLVIPYDVMEVLKVHPAVLQRLNRNQDQVATRESLQTLFGVAEIIVPEVVENTAAEGDDAVLEDLWGRDIIVLYRNPNPGRRRMSLGYTFRWNRPGGAVRRWREEDRETDFFEVGYEEDNKIVAPGAGFVIQEAIPEVAQPAA